MGTGEEGGGWKKGGREEAESGTAGCQLEPKLVFFSSTKNIMFCKEKYLTLTSQGSLSERNKSKLISMRIVEPSMKNFISIRLQINSNATAGLIWKPKAQQTILSITLKT